MAELSVERLRAGYATHDVLSEITLRLVAGQLHAVLGPNGTGKTTLLRALAGLLPLRDGAVVWDEDGNRVALHKLAPLQRAAYIAYVPQLAANEIPLTVSEAVGIAARAGGSGPHPGAGVRPWWRTVMQAENRAAQNIDALLASLGLGEHADTPCPALSGGLWRRVLLAQGLAQRTPLLLLDEPTAFLDPPAREATLALLRRLAESLGLCIICVLHDPPLALAYAHTATAICDGRVLASGPAAQVITPLTLGLLYSVQPGLPTNPPEEPRHAR